MNGTRREAEAFERQQKNRLASGVYIAKTDRRTFAEVVEMFLKERAARDRRTSTLRRADIAHHFDAMRSAGATVQTVNRTLRAMKAVLFFALERELLVERNVMQGFRPFESAKASGT